MAESESTAGGGNTPVGYWVIKGIAIMGICGLAAFDLISDQSVSPVVYGLLAALAGGPELAEKIRPGSSS